MSLTSRSVASSVAAALAVTVALGSGGCDALFPSSKTGAGGSAGPGGQGGSPGTGVNDPANYPHNTPGAAFPYPQGHALAHCTLPSYDASQVATAFTNWKAKFYQGGRVLRPENSNDTASEGIAYGMLIGVYMNDRPMFDALWGYAHARLNGNGLMAWHYNSGGGQLDGGGATDADEDMAWALVMADKQWGGGAAGLPSYLSSATTLIGAIWSHEVDQGGGFVLKPGDNFGGANQTNPSYFAPSYYRVFARVTGNAGWMSVVDSSYSILAKAAGANGLVPNWVNSQGGGVAGPGNDPNGVHFGYDACRTPWRIALDYCENGTPQAQQYMEKIVGFYAGKSSGGGLGAIKDGYTVTGGTPPAPLGMYGAGMAFLGPGGVAALYGGGHESFVSDVYSTLVYDTTTLLNNPGVFSYFNGSWGVLSMMTLSGNFWNMAP
jgi:endo-1,4-beta-D-glucanase Y